MVKGIDQFKAHFAGFADQYVLIGGAACYLAMQEAGLEFRVTKDLDIVLCVEVLDAEFVGAFWEFVKKGGYKNQQKSTGKKLFYRFYEPEDETFPWMLELFSRIPDALTLKGKAHLTPAFRRSFWMKHITASSMTPKRKVLVLQLSHLSA
jgi:hypothetical protein